MEDNTPEFQDEDFSIQIPDFNLDFDLSAFELKEGEQEETRYQKPRLYKPLSSQNIKYDNALALAKELRLEPLGRANVIVAGSFIFGDFIEAFIVEHNIRIKKMTISTLSMSQENVDSLFNLLVGGFVDSLNLIISH